MNKNISIVHPSRGRAQMAIQTARSFLDMAKDKNIEYIISIDSDDRQLSIYNTMFSFATIAVKRNANVVQAMNYGASKATKDILVCVSDDFEPFVHWDVAIKNAIDQDEQLLLVGDGITNKPDSQYVIKHGKRELIATIPILTRKLYNRLGYVYFPQYSGMHADNDLAECCEWLGVAKHCPEIEFIHRHFLTGRAPFDETYKRHNTKSSWTLGEQVIKQRRQSYYGFPKS